MGEGQSRFIFQRHDRERLMPHDDESAGAMRSGEGFDIRE